MPLGIGYVNAANGWTGTGHWLLMSDVRGKSPDRQYLVSDPYSGKTGWVREADLQNGNFAQTGATNAAGQPYGFNLVTPPMVPVRTRCVSPRVDGARTDGQ